MNTYWKIEFVSATVSYIFLLHYYLKISKKKYFSETIKIELHLMFSIFDKFIYISRYFFYLTNVIWSSLCSNLQRIKNQIKIILNQVNVVDLPHQPISLIGFNLNIRGKTEIVSGYKLWTGSILLLCRVLSDMIIRSLLNTST